MERSLCKNWGWILAFGIVSAALGTFVIMLPFIATLAGVITLGSILLAAGIIEFVQAASGKIPQHRLLNIGLGIITAITGLILIVYPLTGALSLTIFIAGFFIVTGIAKIIVALKRNYSHWVLVLFNGVTSLILGGLIFYQWPVSGLWIIGLFIGIDLIMNGWSLIVFALRLRSLCKQ